MEIQYTTTKVTKVPFEGDPPENITKNQVLMQIIRELIYKSF